MYLNKTLLVTACIAVFNLIGSCSPSKRLKPEQINTLVQEKLGTVFTQEVNSSGNFVLYTQNPAEANVKSALKFIVVDIRKNTIIYEGSFLPGYVRWHSETELELLSIPGIIQADEDLSRYKKIISIAQPKH